MLSVSCTCQDLVGAAAAICDVLEEVELLLFSTRANNPADRREPFLELNIFNRASLNLMIANAEHSLRHKHQTVIVDLQITH